MTAAHSTVLYDVKDATIYPLTGDVNGASAPTYGSGIDVPGINAIAIDPNLVSAEIKGDSRVYATKARIDKLTGSFTYSELDLDVLAVLLGGTVYDSGTGSTEVAKYYFKSAELPYFKLEVLIDDVREELAEAVIVLPKVKLDGASLISQSSDSFAQPSANFAAIAPYALIDTYADVLGWVELRETTGWTPGA